MPLLFLDFSPEIHELIFGKLKAADIITCSLTCGSFREIIIQSPDLQYAIALERHSKVNNKHYSGSIRDQLSILRENAIPWSDPRKCAVFTVDKPRHPVTGQAVVIQAPFVFSGDLYIHGMTKANDALENTTMLRGLRVPHGSWTSSSLLSSVHATRAFVLDFVGFENREGVAVVGVSVAQELDLMVIVIRYTDATDDTLTTCAAVFRRASDPSAPHSLASSPASRFLLSTYMFITESDPISTNVDFCGEHIAISIGYSGDGGSSQYHLNVLDWHAGVDKLPHTLSTRLRGAVFLNEELLMCPYFERHSGSLLILHIPSSTSTPPFPQARLVCGFDLPELRAQSDEEDSHHYYNLLDCRSSPNVEIRHPAAGEMPFANDPDKAVIVLTFEFEDFRAGHVFRMVFHRDALMGYLGMDFAASPSLQRITWSTWGAKARWICSLSQELIYSFVSGLKYIEIAGDARQEIHIYDFNAAAKRIVDEAIRDGSYSNQQPTIHRVDTFASGLNNLCPPGIFGPPFQGEQAPIGDFQVFERPKEVTLSSLPCVRVVVPHTDGFSTVLMDEDRYLGISLRDGRQTQVLTLRH